MVSQRRGRKPAPVEEIVVAAHPSTDLGSDIELVKAALLYGDRVRLVSPAAVYLSAVQSIKDLPYYKLALLLRDAGIVSIPEPALGKFKKLADRRNLSTKHLQERRRLEREVKPVR